MIHIFHGFLGSPADFSFLHSDGPIFLHDVYETDPLTLKIGQDDTLIGYSMGGRIAMEIAHKNKFNIKKLVIINSHPGLPESERKDRSLWEDSVLKRLIEATPETFLAYWNSLPLFSTDSPLTELSLEKYAKSEKIFDKYRLSRQRCFLPELEANRDKVLWIAGTQDRKYAEIARSLILPLNIPCIFMEGGHRLYQKKTELQALLQTRKII